MIDKELLKLAIKRVIVDRTFMLLIIGVAILGFIYSFVVAINIQPSDVTLYARYTAFGEGHFYKSHWQYLLSFLAYGLVVSFVHISLMIKLYSIERRQTGILIGWLGVVIIIVSFVYTMSVIGLGYAA